MSKKIFNFDVETTGLYANMHGIIELGGVIEIGDKQVEEFHFKMRPFEDDHVDDKALQIEGRNYTWKEILTWDDPRDCYQQLIDIMHKYVDRFDPSDKFYPCGYNIAFDTNFLIQWFKKNNDEYVGSWLKLNAQIDPLYILRMLDFMDLIWLENYKLETVANALDIPIKAHDALSDIKATIEIRKVVQDLITCD